MEARELRIGNLVKFGENIVPIKSIHSESFFKKEVFVYVELNQNLRHYCLTIEDIQPIPLTEEWLLKFGFTKPNNWHCYELVISDDKLQNLESSLQVSFEGCGFVQICCCGLDSYSAKVIYVHQLQNLYFALTGEEPTIKQTQS